MAVSRNELYLGRVLVGPGGTGKSLMAGDLPEALARSEGGTTTRKGRDSGTPRRWAVQRGSCV